MTAREQAAVIAASVRASLLIAADQGLTVQQALGIELKRALAAELQTVRTDPA